jgi:hypothetical protein
VSHRGASGSHFKGGVLLSEALDLPPPRSCLPWTSEEVDFLRRMLVVRHQSRKKVAIALGRSVNAITTKACELGLARRSPGRAAVRNTDGPTDGRDITAFRKQCEESNTRYIQAVLDAGGGTWSGHVPLNSSGSAR